MAVAVATNSAFSSPFFDMAREQDRYRGAVVEDLQLSPAFALPTTAPLMQAIELAYDRDFSHIPVLDKARKPIGYIEVADLKSRFEAGDANPDDKISRHMVRFKRSPYEPYTVITPNTRLQELEEFLHDNIFALVTDPGRKFVLGVATLQDLETFISRSGFKY